MNRMMQIGELAKLTDVNTKTIRYYEQIGMLEAPPRTGSGYRLYQAEDAARLAFIRRARALDFSLGEIKEILNCRTRGKAPCPYVQQLILQKIAAVEQRMEELTKLKGELRALAREAAHTRIRKTLNTTEICHILERPHQKQTRRDSRARVR